jgi:ABC-type sugar transport system substrate-binding protein
LTQQCANEDYGACLRLGEKAAMAAGIPVGEINQAAKEAQDCYAGDVDACIAIGRRAADAGIPVGGIANGADNLQQCSYGRLDKCQELGQAVASIPR